MRKLGLWTVRILSHQLTKNISVMGLLNRVILQWFFIRLYMGYETVLRGGGNEMILPLHVSAFIRKYYIEAYPSVANCQWLAPSGLIGIMYPVVPLTGWWSDYIPKSRREIVLRKPDI